MNDEKITLTRSDIDSMFGMYISISKLCREADKVFCSKKMSICMGAMDCKYIHLLRESFEKVVAVIQPTLKYDSKWSEDNMKVSFMYDFCGEKYEVFALYEKEE